MKSTYAAAWTLGCLLCLSTSLQATNDTDGEPVIVGRRFSMESKALGETRKFVVHTPENYDFSNDAYPLVILIDSTWNLHHVSASIDYLALAGMLPPMIVVGIENTRRTHDLTPPLTQTSSNPPDDGIGGAPKFLSFIGDELIPHLDRNYRTRPTRILIGHSFGGLFAMHALLNRPDLFKAYIAISPSMWWDNQSLALSAGQLIASHPDLNLAVYMTMANESGQMLGSAQKFSSVLASSPTVSVNFQQWPDENHNSTVIRSVQEGLKWLYGAYYLKEPTRIYRESGLQSFERYSAAMSQQLGYEVKPPQYPYMAIHQWLHAAERFDEDLQVLQRAAALYPESTWPRYGMGDVYMHFKDTERARAAFEYVLNVFPGDPDSRSQMQKLGVDIAALVGDVTLPPASLRAYVGNYRYADETSTVTLENGKLFVQVRDYKSELRPRATENFYMMGVDREYTFQRKFGRVTSVKIDLPDFSYSSRRVR